MTPKGNVCVSENILRAKSPLEGIELDLGGVKVKECASRAIISLGMSSGAKLEVAAGIMSAFNIDIPFVGKSSVSTVNNTRILGMQQDQLYLIFDYFGFDPLEELPKQLQNVAYLTDQTDSWVMVTMSGVNSRSILQQACPIDLHPIIFKEDSVSRTVMEHLSVVILCESLNSFIILSPRSTAKSFLEFIENSMKSFFEEI